MTYQDTLASTEWQTAAQPAALCFKWKYDCKCQVMHLLMNTFLLLHRTLVTVQMKLRIIISEHWLWSSWEQLCRNSIMRYIHLSHNEVWHCSYFQDNCHTQANTHKMSTYCISSAQKNTVSFCVKPTDLGMYQHRKEYEMEFPYAYKNMCKYIKDKE